MFCRMRLAGLAVVTLCLLGLVGPAWGVYPPPIKDEAKFFSKEAVDKANKKIREIYQKYHKDVVVVTVPALSVDQEKKLKEEGNAKFYTKMARDASVELGLNGVYVLIAKKPSHAQIYMDPDTQKKTFTTGNRKTALAKLVAQFSEENFDAGLQDTLDAIEAAFKANSK